MEDGQIVQSGRLLRAAHLADATDEDIRNLERLPVTVVIDFRKEQEKVGKVDREVPGARYTSLPVDPSGNAMATATEEEKKNRDRRAAEEAADVKERKLQKATLAMQAKYGKNAILKGTNFLEGATARERNMQIGGHRSGEGDEQP